MKKRTLEKSKLTKTIKIFLASPSDLKMERKIAKDVVSVVNDSIGRKQRVKFELLRWEDLPATKGRPQSVINQHLLNQADLFVGILWKSWGTPTAKHSSGFEEEFKIAEKQSNIK